MKKLVAFFEIPSNDFDRTVKFYESVFGIAMLRFESESEKMAFFPEEGGKAPGAISWAKDFKPSQSGVLLSLECGSIDAVAPLIEIQGGKIIIPKTKIEAEGRGYFCTFIDSEGNTLGLYSDN